MNTKLADIKGKKNPNGFLLNTPDSLSTNQVIPLGISTFPNKKAVRKIGWCSYFIFGKRLKMILNERSLKNGNAL